MAGQRNASSQPLIDVTDHDRPPSYSSDDDSSAPASPYHKPCDSSHDKNGNSEHTHRLDQYEAEDNASDPEVDHKPRKKSSLSPCLSRSDSVKLRQSTNGRSHRKNSHPMGNSTPPRTSKRVPSLKLKRMNLGVPEKTMPCLPKCNNRPTNPSITITIDSDDDSIYSDYLSPEMNYKNDIKVHFVGDETSLYGTPKEELLPPSGETASTDTKSSPTTFLKEQIISFFQPSDNKLAMKLFGNKKSLQREKMRHKRQGNWVIHPCSNFRFYWDLFMLVLLIANLIILPVAISFFNDDLSTHWIVFNCISDTVFFLDILINFRTGVILNDFADEIILDPKLIAKHYIKSWFFLDFISSIPMDYIILLWDSEADFYQMFQAGRALRMLRLAKLLSLLRLLRLSRLVRYVQQWEEFLALAGKFMRIFNLICLMFLLGHWNGCLQFLIPMLQDFPSDSWVSIEELKDAHWAEQYTWSLFKALSHMLCIGYGRFPPQNMTDTWLTILSMLSGATCYALFLGHTTTIIQSFDTSRRLYNEKPADFIIREGTMGTKMYFIQEGIVDIITKEGEIATSLSDGSYFGEICLLTNAKRVASVRAETYVNLYSLSVEHFNTVLERYPLMRRTMESVAAERLTKIGKNPSIVSSRADLEEDQKLVNEIVMESTPVVTSASEDEDKDSDDSSESSKSSKRKKKFKFDFSGKLHKITEERKSKSKESLRDCLEMPNGKLSSRMKKAPSGSNLFGLKLPMFHDKRRSESVGANLDNLGEPSPRRESDPESNQSESARRGSLASQKLFSVKKKQKSKSVSTDDSPSSEGKSGFMHFLTVPLKSSDSKNKSKSKKTTTSEPSPQEKPTTPPQVAKSDVAIIESSCSDSRQNTPNDSVRVEITAASPETEVRFRNNIDHDSELGMLTVMTTCYYFIIIFHSS
ncbi:hypothetical protein FSP39_013195 [Pinctada imbricata]|uniref:Cyclic nucleotide-binding domain-containing protein n=1 Tax=Pinctada imbricata TaxID=66713 RepID=A0AA88Y4E9_PINIB|nr:hypothetical protein FSP39_013195 [Pinctada imbricata]